MNLWMFAKINCFGSRWWIALKSLQWLTISEGVFVGVAQAGVVSDIYDVLRNDWRR